MKKVTSFCFAVLVSVPACLAHADDCDDYAGRHYRQDLTIAAMKVSDVPRSGEFGPFQDVILTLHNSGDLPFDGSVPCNEPTGCLINVKNITARIGGHETYGWLPSSIPVGGNADVLFRLAGGSLTSCSQTVAIDLNHTVGQWGCQVFNNDSAKLRAQFAANNCTIDFGRIVTRPIPFPIGTPNN